LNSDLKSFNIYNLYIINNVMADAAIHCGVFEHIGQYVENRNAVTDKRFDFTQSLIPVIQEYLKTVFKSTRSKSNSMRFSSGLQALCFILPSCGSLLGYLKARSPFY
jgi:hypothetical protein